MVEKKYIEVEKLPKRKEYWDDDFGAGWDACLDAINSIPAADVREVKRGKWTLGHLPSTSGGSYAVVQCSECNSQFPIWRTNYCPNCGADMRDSDG